MIFIEYRRCIPGAVSHDHLAGLKIQIGMKDETIAHEHFAKGIVGVALTSRIPDGANSSATSWFNRRIFSSFTSSR